MIKQYYNSGNKCFMLIDTERKGGIMKASKTPFPDVPVENIGEYMPEKEEEKSQENENGYFGDQKKSSESVGTSENEGDSNDSEWDDFFG